MRSVRAAAKKRAGGFGGGGGARGSTKKGAKKADGGAALAAAEKAYSKGRDDAVVYVASARGVETDAGAPPRALSDYLPVAEVSVPSGALTDALNSGLHAAASALDGPLSSAANECVARLLKGTSGVGSASLEWAVESIDSYEAAYSAATEAGGADARNKALATLGLDASDEPDRAAIRRAFRKQMAASHPDQNPGDEAAAERYTAVQAAFEVLSGDSVAMSDGGSGYATLAAGSGKRDLTPVKKAAPKAASGADITCGLRLFPAQEVLVFRERNAAFAASERARVSKAAAAAEEEAETVAV